MDNRLNTTDDIARAVMKNANAGDGLASEIASMQTSLTKEQREEVFSKMQGLSGRHGFENVRFEGSAIVFNPHGAEFQDNPTKWKLSSETKILNNPSTSDKVNTLAEIKPLAQEATKEAVAPAPLSEQEKYRQEHWTPLERKLGYSEEELKSDAAASGRAPLIERSSAIAADIIGGKDVYPEFSDLDNNDRRLVWQLVSFELARHSEGGEASVSGGDQERVLTFSMAGEQGKHKVQAVEHMHVLQDVEVNDGAGVLGTGLIGTSLLSNARDVFVTPADRSANQEREHTESMEAGQKMRDKLYGENVEQTQEQQRRMANKIEELSTASDQERQEFIRQAGGKVSLSKEGASSEQ